jgi:hypothetical protein
MTTIFMVTIVRASNLTKIKLTFSKNIKRILKPFNYFYNTGGSESSSGCQNNVSIGTTVPKGIK